MLFNELHKTKYTIHVKDKCLHIQRADYIEDGWYIIYKDELFTVVEIKQYGGNEEVLDDFKCLIDAIKYAESLA